MYTKCTINAQGACDLDVSSKRKKFGRVFVFFNDPLGMENFPQFENVHCKQNKQNEGT